MTVPEAEPVDLPDEVRRAGHTTARKWPGVIDADDAEQEIWLRLLEKNYIERVSEMEPAARAHVLGRIGSQAASGYRDDYEVFSGNLSYGTDEVRALLRSGLLARQRVELDPSSETLTEFLDLHEGAQALRDRAPQYAETLGKVFLLREEPKHSMETTRAVDALTVEMNRVSRRRLVEHDGPGGRQAMSNDQANHNTKEAA